MTRKIMEKANEMTIYIPLLNENINVWRPVLAKEVSSNVFEIVSVNNHSDEEWQFNHGERVKCTYQELNEGKCLVATEKLI